jgi:hypothetical protein
MCSGYGLEMNTKIMPLIVKGNRLYCLISLCKKIDDIRSDQ